MELFPGGPDLSGALILRPAETTSLLARCNGAAERYGLSLTRTQLLELSRDQKRALLDAGRIEFGGGILERLVREFCDSPYLTQENLEETLSSLQELFYEFKNRSTLPDTELLHEMKVLFDEWAQGSAERLADASPAMLERAADGQRPEQPEEEEIDDDD